MRKQNSFKIWLLVTDMYLRKLSFGFHRSLKIKFSKFHPCLLQQRFTRYIIHSNNIRFKHYRAFNISIFTYNSMVLPPYIMIIYNTVKLKSHYYMTWLQLAADLIYSILYEQQLVSCEVYICMPGVKGGKSSMSLT